jgi:hypothetical protein
VVTLSKLARAAGATIESVKHKAYPSIKIVARLSLVVGLLLGLDFSWNCIRFFGFNDWHSSVFLAPSIEGYGSSFSYQIPGGDWFAYYQQGKNQFDIYPVLHFPKPLRK